MAPQPTVQVMLIRTEGMKYQVRVQVFAAPVVGYNKPGAYADLDFTPDLQDRVRRTAEGLAGTVNLAARSRGPRRVEVDPTEAAREAVEALRDVLLEAHSKGIT